MTSRVAVLLCFISFVAIVGSDGRAETYPARPVRIIVPAAAGGALDVNARKVADKLSQALGQQVIVDNRPGANGIIGTDLAAKARPDGYTLLMGSTSTLSINPALYPGLPYRPLDDFVPVTLAVRGSPILLVNPAIPAKTLGEFIAYARARPGQLNYGSPGDGSIQHLAGELLERITGIDMVHVPYKSQPQIMIDLIAGNIHAAVEYGALAAAQVKAGKLRALAIAGPTRKPDLPEVPTAAQADLAGFEVIGWTGYLVPAGTSKEIIARLNREIAAVIAAQDYSQWVISLGSEPVGSTPEAFADIIRTDLASWSKIIKDLGVHVQ